MTPPLSPAPGALSATVQEFLDGYEFRPDGFDHVPTEFERSLLEDFGWGLITELTGAGHMATLSPQPAGGVEDDLAVQLREERAIVSRIWAQLGGHSYEELAGRSIFDLIEELKTQAASTIDARDAFPAPLPIERAHCQETYIVCRQGMLGSHTVATMDAFGTWRLGLMGKDELHFEPTHFWPMRWLLVPRALATPRRSRPEGGEGDPLDQLSAEFRREMDAAMAAARNAKRLAFEIVNLRKPSAGQQINAEESP